jgi:hypothetical protein
MGRLFLSRLGFLCLIAILFANLAIGQNSFYVYKKSGNPFFNASLPVQRGAMFGETDILKLHALDTVFLVNKLGELFELKQPQVYTYESLKDYRKEANNDSFTKKYFSYVWKQFTNQHEIRQMPGVVYRENKKIKLLTPMDSIRWWVPEIKFSWKNDTDNTLVYFHLQDIDTDHITKLGVETNHLILYRDNVILKSGKIYKWAVTTLPFPNFDEVGFNTFELLDREGYEALKKEVHAIKQALKLLGFSEDDIKTAICMDYKFCDY